MLCGCALTVNKQRQMQKGTKRGRGRREGSCRWSREMWHCIYNVGTRRRAHREHMLQHQGLPHPHRGTATSTFSSSCHLGSNYFNASCKKSVPRTPSCSCSYSRSRLPQMMATTTSCRMSHAHT